MRKHVHKWEPLRRGFPIHICRCGCIKALGIQSGNHTLSMTGNLLVWSASQDPDALGKAGMDKATGRLRLYVGGSAKNVLVDGDGFTGTQSRTNTLGGLDMKMTAGENLSSGNVVVCSAGAMTVTKCPTTGDLQSMPIGAVFADALNGADVWVTVAGVGYVLPISTVTAAIGDVLYTGSEAGRVEQADIIPVAATHFREVGHWLENGSGNGVKAKAMIHFN